MPAYAPVDGQPKPPVPGGEPIQPRPLNIHRAIRIVRRIPAVDVIVGTDEHDAFTRPRRPDPRQIVEPDRGSPESHGLAESFDEHTP